MKANCAAARKERADVFLRFFEAKLVHQAVAGKLVGLDITGRGNFYIKNGTFDIKGLIIPAGAINRLLIVDKIPILNSIILGEKNGGLFAIDYYAKKISQNSEVEFVINKSSVLTPGPIRGMINRVKVVFE